MLAELLSRKRQLLAQRWRDRVIETYPPDASKFLTHVTDRFSNPVGYAIQQVIDQTLSALVDRAGTHDLDKALDELMHVRSVQDFSPSQATGFIFLLKNVVRDELGAELEARDLQREMRALEAEVDSLALRAFDLYTACREKIYRIRLGELRGNVLDREELREKRRKTHQRSDAQRLHGKLNS